MKTSQSISVIIIGNNSSPQISSLVVKDFSQKVSDKIFIVGESNLPREMSEISDLEKNFSQQILDTPRSKIHFEICQELQKISLFDFSQEEEKTKGINNFISTSKSVSREEKIRRREEKKRQKYQR